jgi:hypothetical protein
MAEVVEAAVPLFCRVQWQARAALFAHMAAGLGECAALRWLSAACAADGDAQGGEELSCRGARGLVAAVTAGLPAVNLSYVELQQQQQKKKQQQLQQAPLLPQKEETSDAWRALVGAYEAALLSRGVPQHLLGKGALNASSVAAATVASSSAAAGAAAAAAADGEQRQQLQATLLDNLVDVALASCSSAPPQLRTRLVGVLSGGAALGSSTAVSDSTAAGCSNAACATHRLLLSRLCLSKLAVVAGWGGDTGADSAGAAAVLQDVACIALPQLLQHCRDVLRAYACAYKAADTMTGGGRGDAHTHSSSRTRGDGGGHSGGGWRGTMDAASAPTAPPTPGPTTALNPGCGHHQLADEAEAVLQVLLALQPEPAALDAALEHNSVASAILLAAHAAAHAGHRTARTDDSPGSSCSSSKVLSSTATTQQEQQHVAQEQQEQQQQQQQREPEWRLQGHLLLLYEQLAQCTGCPHPKPLLGTLLRDTLLAAGAQLFLC